MKRKCRTTHCIFAVRRSITPLCSGPHKVCWASSFTQQPTEDPDTNSFYRVISDLVHGLRLRPPGEEEKQRNMGIRCQMWRAVLPYFAPLSCGCSATGIRVVVIIEMRGECVMTGAAVIRSGVRAWGRREGPDE
ncbi:unnamed protein product [Leuciscus chuanchicus]